MAVEIPQGDLANTVTHEPDQSYPDRVELRLVWIVDGKESVRDHQISAAEFFGRGSYGAPLPGEALISAIERLRRQGSPMPYSRRTK